MSHDLATIVDVAHRLAQAARGVSKARVRDIYATVLQLRARWEADPSEEKARDIANRLHMLRPRVAYLKAREGGEKAGALVTAIDAIVPQVGQKPTKESIDAFFDFFEAFVAYHRGNA